MCVCLNIMSFGELLKNYIHVYTSSFRVRLSSSLNSVIDNIFMSIVILIVNFSSWAAICVNKLYFVHLYSNIWACWHKF